MNAIQTRVRAEQGCDAEEYQQAAAEFRAVGMLAAAGRCRDRAREYQEPAKICPCCGSSRVWVVMMDMISKLVTWQCHCSHQWNEAL